MSKPLKLNRTKQCAKCPWKVSTDPFTIPNGYTQERHVALASTIAVPGRLPDGNAVHVMSCHEHPKGKEVTCIGWLVNQLGAGNNIALRLNMLRCENIRDVVLDGPQHERFEDTLPRKANV